MLIAFDLDGVLYTAEPFLADAYRESIERVNLRRPGSFDRVPTSEEVLRHVGWPVSTILARLFPEVAPEAMRLIYEVTLEVISARVLDGQGTLFEGVPETLDTLAGRGHDLVVASNGRRRYVEAVLATYDLGRRFAPLLAVEAGRIEDKVHLLRAYVEQFGREPRQVVMVGDRTSDVEAAQALGCDFIGCDYGHGHRDEIEGRGPIVSSFPQLAEVLP
jgi:phosphoglycolate phosphatase